MALALVAVILAISVTATAWVVGIQQRKSIEAFLKHMAETQVVGQPIELIRDKLEADKEATALHREYLKQKQKRTPEGIIS